MKKLFVAVSEFMFLLTALFFRLLILSVISMWLWNGALPQYRVTLLQALQLVALINLLTYKSTKVQS